MPMTTARVRMSKRWGPSSSTVAGGAAATGRAPGRVAGAGGSGRATSRTYTFVCGIDHDRAAGLARALALAGADRDLQALCRLVDHDHHVADLDRVTDARDHSGVTGGSRPGRDAATARSEHEA